MRDGALATGEFWRPTYVPKHELGESAAVEQLDARLALSVESMLVADVPLGAFVSGGVDSGVVAALATRISGRALDTFNLGFTGSGVGSEHDRGGPRCAAHRQPASLPHAGARRRAARARRWVDVFDEPFGDQAALPTMLLAQYARREVTVVLTGEGADEVFGGYSNYVKRLREERLTARARRARLAVPVACPPPAAAARARPDRQGRVRTAFAPLRDHPEHLRLAVARANISRRRSPPPRARGSPIMPRSFYDACDSPDYLDHLLDIDARLWLPDDLLAKVDRATMAFSLEARVPYLDHVLYGWCARLPSSLKVRGNARKRLLKSLALRYLPPDIVHREKQGFMMPLSRWLAHELKADVAHALGPRGLARRGLIRPQALERLVAEHVSGRKNHAMRLWTLLILERWFARYEPDFRLQ